MVICSLLFTAQPSSRVARTLRRKKSMPIPDLTTVQLASVTMPLFADNQPQWSRPVFIVEDNIHTKYVVKAELVSKPRLPITLSQPLQRERLSQSLLVMAKLFRDITPNFPELRLLQPNEKPAVRGILNAAQQKYFDYIDQSAPCCIWYVMGYVNQLIDLDNRGNAHNWQNDVSQRLSANGYNAFEAFGKIAVVDAFVDNTDRFGETGSVDNPNNVLLGPNGPVGLDFFNYNSPYIDLYTPNTPGADWLGKKVLWLIKKFLKPGDREQFATTAVNAVLTKAKMGTAALPWALEAFLRGMQQATNDLDAAINGNWAGYEWNQASPSDQLKLRRVVLN